MSNELQDFETQVRQRSKEIPVLVDSWAPRCGPCRTLGPVLERMATQAHGRWELVKVNTEEHQDVAAGFQIASIPAAKLLEPITGSEPGNLEARVLLAQALLSTNPERAATLCARTGGLYRGP